jgi:hypothetical protein
MREGTTSKVMAADSSCDKFYDFYSASPEYFGFTLVFHPETQTLNTETGRFIAETRIFSARRTT